MPLALPVQMEEHFCRAYQHQDWMTIEQDFGISDTSEPMTIDHSTMYNLTKSTHEAATPRSKNFHRNQKWTFKWEQGNMQVSQRTLREYVQLADTIETPLHTDTLPVTRGAYCACIHSTIPNPMREYKVSEVLEMGMTYVSWDGVWVHIKHLQPCFSALPAIPFLFSIDSKG